MDIMIHVNNFFVKYWNAVFVLRLCLHKAMNRPHPFDRYSDFTDVAALKEFSEKRLRKSVRVNTLKSSIAYFQEYAKEQGWHLSPVPWCSEGFFLDRDAPHPNPLPQREREYKALGRDVLHLLGHFYMQEAASMLPVSLLDPKPGESVLDMSAAPGSKTTQIAARMQGRGVIVANDVQEKRLWTLKSALHRSGVHNVIVTKKVGQWFGKHMTERFDRVLCDAPCTAQGTARKDSDALKYSSETNVIKMARLQENLLEAAVHAAKVGGTIVYSTCTLTPEENEELVRKILNKFCDQLAMVDPRSVMVSADESMTRAIDDSARVQASIDASPPVPMLRLWPHVHDVEGFFAAALRKIKPTRHPEPMERVEFQETIVPEGRRVAFAEYLNEKFGAALIDDGDVLFERASESDVPGAEELQITTRAAAEFSLPVENYSLGLPFGRRIVDGKIRLGNEFASLRGGRATRNVIRLDDAQRDRVLAGQDMLCDPSLDGDCVLLWRDIALGLGLAKNGTLKNRLSRWVVQRS